MENSFKSTAIHVLRVRQALQANRASAWQFPGYYLGISFDRLDDEGALVSLPVGAHCTGPDGRVALAVTCVMADIAVGAAVRQRSGSNVRLATLSARLNFGECSAAGRLVARSVRQGDIDELALRSSVGKVEVQADGGLLCFGEARFAVMDNRLGTPPHPLPRGVQMESFRPLDEAELTDPERVVVERAEAAASAVDGHNSFIEQFWDLVPRVSPEGASCSLRRGPHVGNRVGDVQGGILLGLASTTSAAALPAGWKLLDISAHFLASGSGAVVTARARPLRVGKSVAFIECVVSDESGVQMVHATCTLGRVVSA